MLIAVTSVISIPAFSEYLRDRNREKRVVANISTEGKRFSSDRLTNASDASAYEVPVTIGNDQETVTVDFQIFNHIYSDTMHYYPSPIYYQIEAKLVNQTGNTISASNSYFESGKYGIKKYNDTNFTTFSAYNSEIPDLTEPENPVRIKNQFSGNAEETPHKYLLCFPTNLKDAADEDRIYIELKAVPCSDAGLTHPISELGVLKGRLSFTPKAQSISLGWSGEFQEKALILT